MHEIINPQSIFSNNSHLRLSSCGKCDLLLGGKIQIIPGNNSSQDEEILIKVRFYLLVHLSEDDSGCVVIGVFTVSLWAKGFTSCRPRDIGDTISIFNFNEIMC